MSAKHLLALLFSVVCLVFLSITGAVYAHRSGCHSNHSCPSDTGSYVCGDKGYCSNCPDNAYCYKKKVRQKATSGIRSATTTISDSKQSTTTASIKIKTNALITRVVDGDTFVAKLDAESGKEYKVRLLGVNTPETVDPRRAVQCFGKQASAFSKHTLTNKRVRLDADPQADERDKYNRLLRNVILEDGTDFNAKLVSEGYAYAYLSFPLNPARKAELRRLEAEAKTANRGLWGEGTCNN